MRGLLQNIKLFRSRLNSCALAMLVTCSCAFGQPDDDVQVNPLQEDISQRVAELVAALDSDELAERERAERGLLQLGPKILQLLPEPTVLTSAESRVRLQRTLGILRERQITDAVEPTTITVDGIYSLNDLFREIAIQTENRIQPLATDDFVSDWKFENVPFWEAIDAILERSGMELVPFAASPQGLMLREVISASKESRSAVNYAGVFRLQVASVTAKKNFLSPQSNVLQVMTWLVWEPRSHPIFLQLHHDDLQAILEDGTRLNIEANSASREYQPQKGSSQIELELAFQLPNRSAAAIKTIRGSFTAALPGRSVEMAFGDLDHSEKQVQELANLTVAVEPWRKKNAFHELRFRVRLEDAERTTESFRGWFFENEYYLQNEQGKKVETVGSTTTGLSGNEISMSLLYELEDDPSTYRFIYRAPGSIIERKFDFELQDISLP